MNVYRFLMKYQGTSKITGENLISSRVKEGLEDRQMVEELLREEGENSMTAWQYCKENNITMKEVSKITEQSIETLRNWFNNPKKSKLFEVVVKGAKLERYINDN